MKRRQFLRLGAIAAAGSYGLGLARPGSIAAKMFDRGAIQVVRGTVRLHSHTVPPGGILRFDPNVSTTLRDARQPRRRRARWR